MMGWEIDRVCSGISRNKLTNHDAMMGYGLKFHEIFGKYRAHFPANMANLSGSAQLIP
jgi:hypothetical protein